MKNLTRLEKLIARYIQRDIPLKKRLFMDIGIRLGLRENHVLSIIKGMKENGVIRKFSAIVRHQRAGYTTNAMVMWAVPETRCDLIGNMAGPCRRGAAPPRRDECYP